MKKLTKFGIEFVPQEAYWKTVFYAIQSERRGFDYLWITDHFNNRNVYATLAVTAIYTRRIRMGPGVTNPFLSHPVVTAQAVASINEMAPGRVVCGIGAGDTTTLKMLGVAPRRVLTSVKEATEIIRKITAGENVQMKGVFSVAGAKLNFKVRERIPIYVGAQGPKMLALAGAIGDGVLINASSKKDIEPALGHVREGAEEAGRKIDEIDVAAYASFSVDEEEKKAIEAACPVVAFIVAGSPQNILERHGIPEADVQSIRDALARKEWGKAFSSVTPEMLSAFSIHGTPDMCSEKISRLLKLGVTQFVVGSPIGPNVRKSIDTIGERILPNFK